MCVALGMDEATPELGFIEVKDWILLSTWLGVAVAMVLEPQDAAVQLVRGGCVSTTALLLLLLYAGGSGGVSARQKCDLARDWA